MRLASLGDLILDVVVALEGPLVPGDDRPAITQVGAGGQAANVAAWAAALGAQARFIGKRGSDPAGQLAARSSSRRTASSSSGRPRAETASSSRSRQRRDRSMASDRGVAPELRRDELDPAWFRCDVLHVSGYSLLQRARSRARHRPPGGSPARAGARVSVDLSSWTLDRRAVPRAGQRARAGRRLRDRA